MTGIRHDAGNEKKKYRAKLGTFGFYNRGSNSSFWTPHFKGHWQIGAWLSLADWVHSLGSFISRMKQSWDKKPCLAHSQLHSGALLLTEHTLRLHNKYVWGEVNEMSAATVTHHTSLSPLHKTYLPSDWTISSSFPNLLSGKTFLPAGNVGHNDWRLSSPWRTYPSISC